MPSCTFLVVSIVVFITKSSNAFISTPRCIGHPHKSLMLFYMPSSSSDEEDIFLTSKTSPPWTMEQDWALMDALPKFTVGGGEFKRTFWSQLASCTPILSMYPKQDLLKRCQELQTQHEKQNSTTAKITSRPISYGPPPTLLQNWQIDLDRRDGKAVGQTKDGRTIWLRYHTIGRLEGDPFQDVYSTSAFSLIPGGYLEAVGGRIYELGEPRDQQYQVVRTDRTGDIAESTNKVDSSSQDKEKSLDWWIPPVTGTISALLASTVLSACIGYAAGLSIIQDGSATSLHSSSNTPSSLPYNPVNKAALDNPTIAEQKARAEYRVLREQRLLEKLSDKLDQDKKELLELRRLE